MQKLILLIITLLLISCIQESYTQKTINDVLITTNRTAANLNFEVKLNLVQEFEISAIDTFKSVRIKDIYLNKRGELFFSDMVNYKIHKFSRGGKYLISFGNNGHGPFEFTGYTTMIVHDERIIINAININRTIYYDFSGNGLKQETYTDNIKAPTFLTAENGQIINVRSGTLSIDGGLLVRQRISILDKNLKEKLIISNLEFNLKENSLNNPPAAPPFAITDTGGFYRAIISKNDYQIEEFSSTGVKKAVIIKKCRKLAYADSTYTKMKRDNSKSKYKENIHKYMDQISYIAYDSQGYLWIRPNLRDDKIRYYDIFKDYIFRNRVEIKLQKGENFIRLDNGKLITLSDEEDLIKVYDIKYLDN